MNGLILLAGLAIVWLTAEIVARLGLVEPCEECACGRLVPTVAIAAHHDVCTEHRLTRRGQR